MKPIEPRGRPVRIPESAEAHVVTIREAIAQVHAAAQELVDTWHDIHAGPMEEVYDLLTPFEEGIVHCASDVCKAFNEREADGGPGTPDGNE